jgi:predicted flap endonuclease-1-like 5' DNA nuclease
MRSDYALYAVAIVCLIIAIAVAAYATTTAPSQNLWIIVPAVFALAFIGIGYSQRPREEPAMHPIVAPPPPPPTQPTPLTPKTTEVVQEAKVESQPAPVIEVKPPSLGLLDVKGIKDRRAQQLKAIGIYTVEDLAKASPQELAAKLKIAPYFTGQWIESAKKLVQKS